MKDSFGRVHIFEVKSVNISSNMVGGFDNNIYKAKLEELKKAYKQASRKLPNIYSTCRSYVKIIGVFSNLSKAVKKI